MGRRPIGKCAMTGAERVARHRAKLKPARHRFDNSKRRRNAAHDRQRMLTPPYVLEPVRKLLGGIGLDPCTEPDNPTGAFQFYAPLSTDASCRGTLPRYLLIRPMAKPVGGSSVRTRHRPAQLLRS
jgi:hypothetical protein